MNITEINKSLEKDVQAEIHKNGQFIQRAVLGPGNEAFEEVKRIFSLIGELYQDNDVQMREVRRAARAFREFFILQYLDNLDYLSGIDPYKHRVDYEAKVSENPFLQNPVGEFRKIYMETEEEDTSLPEELRMLVFS